MQRTKRTKKFILFLVISIATIIFSIPHILGNHHCV